MYFILSVSSLLAAKNVDLVVARVGFLCIMETFVFFIIATLITEVLFKQLIHTAVYRVEPSWQRSIMDSSVSSDNGFFKSGYFDYRGAFRAVLDEQS